MVGNMRPVASTAEYVDVGWQAESSKTEVDVYCVVYGVWLGSQGRAGWLADGSGFSDGWCVGLEARHGDDDEDDYSH
jgi:hypothetical protein